MKIALLTCQALPNLTDSDQLLIPALAKHNIEAYPVIWDDKTIIWTDFDYLVFRNTWDYFEKEEEFNSWLNSLKKLGIKTLNSIEIIEQNKHKFYLKDLEQKGIKIIPTQFISKTNHQNLKEILPKHWKKSVIKPAFSAGSYLTEVFNNDNLEAIELKYKTIASQKDMLIQEFMPQIQTLGETSFIFLNKKFSHCVNKKPIENEFRIQVQFGGKYTLVHPSEDLIQQAQKIIDTFQGNLLYARVDGIVIENEIHLMEVECIEPDLYFNLAQNSQVQFVTSLLQLIA
ncbi:ATP-grasp domain-containing protein [uncultured Flavobacterium sp.]|uniref:ATP-grasp domain-containing protein n=1 Tax=uncultured Flavobacterium sp. TaxID=165435 RepID=UPI0030EF9F7E|tara:strand:+ start:15067 stop:15924 length:858 start_codon:yes stop_codon:yes gene_type:complete